MGVVTVSSSAARTPLGSSTTRLSRPSSPTKRVSILQFKTDKTRNKALVAPKESLSLPIEKLKVKQKILRQVKKKPTERLQALSTTAEAPSCPLDLDYNEAAAKLENIYKLSPAPDLFDDVDKDCGEKIVRRRRKKIKNDDGDDKVENGGTTVDNIVRSKKPKSTKRLSLEKRIKLRMNKEVEVASAVQRRKLHGDNEVEKINKLIREYSASTDLVSLDWKKMKIPPVLSSSEHNSLFKLMQPMKVSIFLLHTP